MSKHIKQQADLQKRDLQKRARIALAVVLGLTAATTMAADLNLSNNALEVVTAVEPNIMIVTDDSGSMDWEIMSTDYANGGRFTGTQPDGSSPAGSGSVKHRDDNNDGTADCGFNDGYSTGYLYIVEFGNNNYSDSGLDCNTADDEAWRIRNSDFNPMYFDPTKTYLPWEGVDASGNSYADIDITNAPDNPYSPNEWIDLTRHNSDRNDSTGARFTSDRDGDGNPDGFRYYTWTDANSNGLFDDGEETEHKIRDKDATTQQNFANWFGYYRKRDLTAKAAFSQAITPADNVRIGYATINNSGSDNLRVASMNVSPASGNKRSLFDKLFATTPSGGTPLQIALRNTGRYFDCAAYDIFGSTASSAPGSSTCPVEAAPVGQCQQNYTILMTDGFYNPGSPGVGNVDDDGGDFAGGAFEDSYENTLADIAMHYYKTDLHSAADNVPTSARDIAGYRGATSPFETMHQHMATYTVGFGVEGSLTASPSDPNMTTFVWPNPADGNAEKIDDLRHAAYNGRGQFLSANDPVALATAMENIFNDIAAATGTATAVAFNTQEVESGTLVFRASFNTKTNEGDLVAQHVNPDGTVNPAIVWSAATQLDNKTSSDADTRTIITYQNNGDSTSTGVPFQWASLNAAQQALLNAPQPANVLAATNTFGDERLEHLRGHSQYEGTNYDSGEFRERADVAGKLGDIVHSTPVFVGKPEFLGRSGGAYPNTTGNLYADFVSARQTRPEVTYTGANDGMLHAFNTTNGSELFAYVPNIMMSNLSDLTDPDYAHRYYVDLSPAINDIYFSPSSGTNSGTLSWNTVLIGGLAAGGKGYYALNVTDPGDLDTEAEAKENVLWEFTEADDGGVGSSDLGYSYSQPIIAMSNADDGSGNKEWVAIFGNGYNSTSTDGDSALYILRIEGGQDGVWTSGTDFIKVSTGYGRTESGTDTPNGIGGVRAIDTNDDGTVDYVYAGDLQGNLYRFDLTSGTASDWAGAPKILFTASYSGTLQPITTSPIVVAHPTTPGEFVVIAATGSWMTTEDATSTDIQSIYGIWDDMSTNPLVLSSALQEQVFTNHVSAEHGFTVRTLTNNDVNLVTSGPPADRDKGWYIDLDVPPAVGSGVEFPGERATRNLQLRGGILFVNTIIPKDTAACSVGVGGYELAFDPTTGGSGSTVIFDLDGNNNFGDEDNVNDTTGDANIVTGIQFDGGTPSDAAFIGSRRMTQVGDEIRSFNTNTGDSPNTGRTSWREITQ
ncbi:MAG: PilC/PilY family type IV pilus protein [Gammaproteobacteria bacterium]|nr:PilC/PilY family type IV pilus protein [Gammaproteobacteria bacterium]